MKHIILFLQIFTLIFFIANASAQTIESNYGTVSLRPVEAKSGLTLREGPGTEFKKLSAIPFGEYVVTSLIEKSAHDIIENKEGNWLLAEYDGQTGFVFDGFLGPEKYSICGDMGYADAAIKGKELLGIYSQPLPDFGYHTFSALPTILDTAEWALKINGAQQINNLKNDPILEHPIFTFYGVGAKKRDMDGYIFSYDESPLYPGRVTVMHFENERYILSATGTVTPNENSDYGWATSVIKDYKLILKKVGKDSSEEQILLEIKEDIYASESGSIGLPNIRFAGDIDNDGKPDFIFEKHFEYSYGEMLFLSSEAEKGFLVKLVYMHLKGCC